MVVWWLFSLGLGLGHGWLVVEEARELHALVAVGMVLAVVCGVVWAGLWAEVWDLVVGWHLVVGLVVYLLVFLGLEPGHGLGWLEVVVSMGLVVLESAWLLVVAVEVGVPEIVVVIAEVL